MLYRVCRHHQPCAAELKVHRAVVDNVELDVRVSTGATQRAPSSLSHALHSTCAGRQIRGFGRRPGWGEQNGVATQRGVAWRTSAAGSA